MHRFVWPFDTRGEGELILNQTRNRNIPCMSVIALVNDVLVAEQATLTSDKVCGHKL